MTTAHELALHAPPGVCLLFTNGEARNEEAHPVEALAMIPDDIARDVIAVTVHTTGTAYNPDTGHDRRSIVVLYARTRDGDDAALVIDADGITTPASPALGAIPDAAARLFAVR